MRTRLYLANFPPETTGDQLRELFAPYGEVRSVEFGVIAQRSEPCAVVELATEKAATKANHGLNGHVLGSRRLAVSYPNVDWSKELTSGQRKTAEAVAAELGETEEKPIRQIRAMALLCGPAFVQALLQEVLDVEAGGGLFTVAGERRTKGGVFFYLARFRVAPPVRAIIYNRHGKMPPEPPAEPAEASAPPGEAKKF